MLFQFWALANVAFDSAQRCVWEGTKAGPPYLGPYLEPFPDRFLLYTFRINEPI